MQHQQQIINREFKVTLVGDAGVGKTALINRLLHGEFSPNYVPTVGIEVYPYVQDGILYNIWDTAGQEKFSGLGNGHYIGSSVVIIMCANDSELSQKSINKWKADIRNACGNDVKIIVVNNKIDITNSNPNKTFADVDISVKYNTCWTTDEGDGSGIGLLMDKIYAACNML